MQSQNLSEEELRGTYFETKHIIDLFSEQQKNGIEGMNLKLVIDLLGRIGVKA